MVSEAMEPGVMPVSATNALQMSDFEVERIRAEPFGEHGITELHVGVRQAASSNGDGPTWCDAQRSSRGVIEWSTARRREQFDAHRLEPKSPSTYRKRPLPSSYRHR